MARAGKKTALLDPPETAETAEPEEIEAGDTAEPTQLTVAEDRAGFFQFLAAFTRADWEKHLAYIYRLAPLTDRYAGGATNKYIMRYSMAFDEETLKHDAGSGTYRILVNRIASNGRSKVIKQVELDIEDMNFPPRVPPGEWLDDARNKRWAWARTPAPGAQPANQPAAQTGLDPGALIRMIRDVIHEIKPHAGQDEQQSVTKHVLDAVKETRAELAAASDPTKTMAFIKDIVTTFLPKPEAKPAGDPLITLLMAQVDRMHSELQEERKFTRELLAKQNTGGGQGKQSDMLEVVNRALDIRDRLGEIGGDGVRRGAGGWGETGMRLLEQHLPRALDVLGAFARPAGGGYASQSTPLQTATPPAAQQIQSQDEQMPPPQQTNLDPEMAALRETFLQFGPLFVKKFKEGMPGGDMADLIVLLSGAAEYQRIRLLGKQKIVAVMQTIPPMWQEVSPYQAVLDKFLDEFIEPPGDDEPDAAQPAAPAAPAAAPRKKGK